MAPVLGTSNTNMSNLNAGALKDLPSNLKQASLLATALTPSRKPMDPALLSLLYFSELGKQASQPGATALGAATSAVTTPAAYLLKDREAQADDAKTRATLTASLAGSLKPKTGAPKVVNMGPAMDGVSGEQKQDSEGNLLFKFNVYNVDGSVQSSYNAPRKSGINIDVGKKSDTKFGEVLASNNAKAFAGHLDASDKAQGSLTTVGQLLDIVASPDFTSGPFESFMLPLKTFALSFGLIGKDDSTIDNIASAELFRAKTYELALAAVSKMKGALSDRELGFLQAQQASLSATPAGNRLLLVMQKQQLNKAAAFRNYVNNWAKENNDGKFPADNASYSQMMQDWQKSDIMKENPYQFVIKTIEKETKEMFLNQGGSLDNDGDMDLDSLPDEKQKEIANFMNRKYGVARLDKLFNKSGFNLD
tara:strand:+ start:180 stop:1442 length:1263 start_codon:yes stop_codon:yes gene_type:complete